MYERLVHLSTRIRLYQFLIALFVVGLLAFPVTHLTLLLDDNTFIFPSILGVYMQHFSGYLYDYGLLRPLAIIYYYGIYTLYLHTPMLAHMLPYAFQVATGFVLFMLLKKNLKTSEAMSIALLYIAFPLFTEEYGWLAASNATLANFTLMLQLWLVYTDMKLGKKILLLVILQIIGVLLYESVFFTCGIIALLVVYKEHVKLFSLKSIAIGALMVLPSLLYVGLRNLIFPAHLMSTVRELKISQLDSSAIFSVPFHDAYMLFMSFKFLTDPYNIQHFWVDNALTAFQSITTSSFGAIMMENTLIAIIIWLFLQRQEPPVSLSEPTLTKPLPLLGLLLTTLLPTFLLLNPAYPFRVLALPLFFLLVGMLFLIKRISHTIYTVLLLLCVFYSVFASYTMLTKMGAQGVADKAMVQSMMETLDPKIPTGEKTTLYIENMVQSTQTDFIYGEYAGSCVNVDWCLQAMLNLRTDKINHIEINKQKETAEDGIHFKYDYVTKKLVFVK